MTTTIYQMQAQDSVDGAIYTWVSTGTADWSATGFPGPNSAIPATVAIYSDRDVEGGDSVATEFTNDTPGGGNPRQKVAPDYARAVPVIADGASLDIDFDPGFDNAYFTISALATLRLENGQYRRVAAMIDAHFDTGVFFTDGAQVSIPGGNDAGVTLTLSSAVGGLRVNIANSSGGLIAGTIEVSWSKRDAVAVPTSPGTITTLTPVSVGGSVADGSYASQAQLATSGSGTGAVVTLEILGNSVDAHTLVAAGTGHAVNDELDFISTTAANRVRMRVTAVT